MDSSREDTNNEGHVSEDLRMTAEDQVEYNDKLDIVISEDKLTNEVPSNESRGLLMEDKGSMEIPRCHYRGVKQRRYLINVFLKL